MTPSRASRLRWFLFGAALGMAVGCSSPAGDGGGSSDGGAAAMTLDGAGDASPLLATPLLRPDGAASGESGHGGADSGWDDATLEDAHGHEHVDATAPEHDAAHCAGDGAADGDATDCAPDGDATDSAPDGDATDGATDGDATDGDATDGDATHDGSPPDDASDAAETGPSTPPTTQDVLRARSSMCLACAMPCVQSDIVTPEDCESLGPGAADAGPAAGSAIVPLCLDTLTCLLAGGCVSADGNVFGCYCGPGMCGSAALPSGSCKAEEERGLYTTDESSIVDPNVFMDPYSAAGRANTLASCLATSCPSCF